MQKPGYILPVATGCILLCVAMSGCNQNPRTTDRDLERINYDELVGMLAASDGSGNTGGFFGIGGRSTGNVVLVDARRPADYAGGHIPAAVNIVLPEMRTNDPRLAEATSIVVYGQGRTDYLARAGAKKLLALGYDNVVFFPGGIEDWQAEGRALEKTEPTESDANASP